MKKSLKVSEYFYSVQGEGTTTGIPAYFIRLTACNLMCGGYGTQKTGLLYGGATWRCDTIDVWRKGEDMTFEQIYNALGGAEFQEKVRAGAHVIFTGGEPMKQQEQIKEFLMWMRSEHKLWPIIEIETNGTIEPIDELRMWVHYWNVSPKLSNSGMPKQKRINQSALQMLSECDYGEAMFKFVVNRDEDWDEIHDDFLPYINRKQVVLMPAAESIAELERVGPVVAELAKKHVVRMCTRMHVVIWNQLTGV